MSPIAFEEVWTIYCERHAVTHQMLHVHDLYMVFMAFMRRGGMEQVRNLQASPTLVESIFEDIRAELERLVIKWSTRFDWSAAQLSAFYIEFLAFSSLKMNQQTDAWRQQ